MASSKEEILEKRWMGKNDVYAASDNVLGAMDDFAKQEAIEFMKWWREGERKKYNQEMYGKTPEQLFEMFTKK